MQPREKAVLFATDVSWIHDEESPMDVVLPNKDWCILFSPFPSINDIGLVTPMERFAACSVSSTLWTASDFDISKEDEKGQRHIAMINKADTAWHQVYTLRRGPLM